MRLFVFTLLVMAAFAANAVINRFALVHNTIDAASFAIIRTFAATLVLTVLVAAQRTEWKILSRWRPVSALMLAIHLVCFSIAYARLDIHAGALILFAGVQLILFLAAVFTRHPYGTGQWLGMLCLLLGLGWLVWPRDPAEVDLIAAGFMAAAAVGWAAHSLIERSAPDLLGSSAASFALAAPLSLLGLFYTGFTVTPSGIALAGLSGLLTTGFGLALWYTILPRIRASSASIAQISVPIIAAYGGVIYLGERLGLSFIIAAVLILGGMALAIASQPRRPPPQGDAD